jgi:hypothetical protein
VNLVRFCRYRMRRAIWSSMNKDKIDEAVLALLYLGHWLERHSGVARSWKSFDWDTMERLHDRGLISNPATKAKSVTISGEGLRKAKEAYDRLFENTAPT